MRRLRLGGETLGVGEVRVAAQGDATAVEAVWAEVAAEGEWIGAEAPLDPGWRDRFRATLAGPQSCCFVAEVDGQVVGSLCIRDEHGIAHLGMALRADHRGAGLGRLLLDAAVDWARRRGCHKVGLEVWPHNTRARRFYERAGFAEEGYLRRHYRRRSGALWDTVVMGLVLDHDSPGRS